MGHTVTVVAEAEVKFPSIYRVAPGGQLGVPAFANGLVVLELHQVAVSKCQLPSDTVEDEPTIEFIESDNP